ncbi:MAG: T9SS type A sorting domain-containing protein, partial [Saprospiraceae bacterium]|nr:T9SS type A sorting domain-containing protein [Saprospiraceae bacterium]
TFRLPRSPAFQVPFQGERSPASIFSTSLWMGGFDKQNEISVAAFTYSNRSQPGFRPGPLTTASLISPDTASHLWDTIFMVHGQEILRHIEDAKDGTVDQPLSSIFGWPSKGNRFYRDHHDIDLSNVNAPLADFRDLNGNDRYDPDEGEYPVVRGVSPTSIPSAIAWCVFNTKSSEVNDNINSPSIEIHQTCWTMPCGEYILEQTVFTRYELFNRGDQDLRDFRLGLMMDQQMGDISDNGFGTDTTRHTVYMYNMDNADVDTMDRYGNTQAVYGHNPPVQTISFLDRNLEGVSYWNHHPLYHFPIPTLDPQTDLEFYRRLNGRWWTNEPMTPRRWGYNPGSTDTTLFAFYSHPSDTSGWSLYQAGLHPFQVPVAINRFGHSDGWFPVNDSFELNIAFTLHRDTTLDHLAQIDPALENVERMISLFQDGMPNCMPQPGVCDDVWPGDADASGRVDYLDAVNLFRSYGLSGAERETDLSFTGRPATDWGNSDPYGLNAKHADINGDGIIDQNDWDLLPLYLGYQNACYEHRSISCDQSDDLTWYSHQSDTVLNEGDLLRYSLLLNNINELQGLSLKLEYDEELLDFKELRYDMKWAEDSVSLLTFEQSMENGEGLVAFNDQGRGVLLEDDQNAILFLAFTVRELPDSAQVKSTPIRVCPAIIYYDDQKNDTLSPRDIDLYFPDSVVVSSSEELSSDPFKIFPNPSANSLNVKGSAIMEAIEIYDAFGCRVKRHPVGSVTTYSLDISDIPGGTYFIRILGKDRFWLKKLIIQNKD